MNPESERNHSRRALAIGIAAMALLAFAVYLPILPGSFLMDDARLIGSDNLLVNGRLTPYSLWFRVDFSLSTFGWWVEHNTFGPHPAGYHVVNIVLHALSAVLLWRLLVGLKIPGAWLAGALFAAHPVCVNSVARISELKNTLSLPFFLLSFIAYLRYETASLYPAQRAAEDQRDSSDKATLWYVISLVAFILALLAKSTTVMLPVVILLCAAWQRGRIALKDIIHTLPLFVLSIGFGLFAVWSQKFQALPTSELALSPASFAQRLAGAGDDFWFYIGKALFPFHLSIQYPRWTINSASMLAWLPDLLAGGIFLLCAPFYRSWGRHVLFGLGSFAVLLFPALGFFDAQFLTMWQVSDHLQYTALPAIIALVVAGIVSVCPKSFFPPLAAVLLSFFSVLCFQRATAFRTQESLMLDTLDKYPMTANAHNDLGIVYAERGNYAGAMQEFKTALKDDPNNVDALVDLGHALTMQSQYAGADAQFRAALKLQPHNAQTHKLYSNLLAHEGKSAAAVYHLQLAALFKPDVETLMQLASISYATGDPHRAVAYLRQAVALTPDPRALNNLAWILATCPDSSVRNGREAVIYALAACKMAAFRQPGMVGTLAAAYAEAGQFPQAVTMAATAIKIANDSGNAQFAAQNRQMLLLYQAGKPYHGNVPGQ
jgi:protein O-mannosyl-transferase